jgi:ABC-type transport system involved in multi-copper enzyme maturation permease subunit
MHDLPFFHMVRWETRLLYGRRRVVWLLVLTAAALAVMAGAWRAAYLPLEEYFFTGDTVPTAILAALMATPFRDPVASLGQMTFGYAFLRYSVYALLFLARLLLPALAAGSIGNDRRTGRMEELRAAPLTIRGIFLAKALAAALPFLALGVALFALFAGVAAAEGVPVVEVGRLALEFTGQVLLTAFVALACSALFRSPWTARAVAFFALWLALPAAWFGLISFMNEPSSFPVAWRHAYPPEVVAFPVRCAVYLALTLAGCLLAFDVGVNALNPLGFWGAALRRLRRVFPAGRRARPAE